MLTKLRNFLSTKSKTDLAILIAGACFLILFLVAAAWLAIYYYDAHKEQVVQQELGSRKEAIDGADDTDDEDKAAKATLDYSLSAVLARNYATMKGLNEDYVFWVYVPGTGINYPVVQRDNSYYLKHNFYQKSNSHGAIFLDEGCLLEDTVLLLHGHHMRDGSMFAALKKYKTKSFIEENNTIVVETETEYLTYTIFAVALVDLTEEEYFEYTALPGTDEAAVEAYLADIKANAIYYKEPDTIVETAGDTYATTETAENTATSSSTTTETAEDTDTSTNSKAPRQYIALATCSYGTSEERLLVVGYR